VLCASSSPKAWPVSGKPSIWASAPETKEDSPPVITRSATDVVSDDDLFFVRVQPRPFLSYLISSISFEDTSEGICKIGFSQNSIFTLYLPAGSLGGRDA